MSLQSNVPQGPIETLWEKHKFNMKLVNPANRRKYKVIVVGTGLAGGAAAASLGEMGYHVKNFCIQDSARRAHSIAAQGGINAAKNYPNDGDSIYRLFYDTVKGGDFRSREANVYRLAQNSNLIIDHCVAQGVPFAREYGWLTNKPIFWWRSGCKNLLCPRANRSTASYRGLFGFDETGQCRNRRDVFSL